MSRISTLPNLKNTLKFCQFLLDCSEEDYHQNVEWTREVRQHKYILSQFLKLVENESEGETMEMSRKSYEQAEKTFGKELAARLFKDVKIIDGYVAPVNAKKLFEAIKAKKLVASRTKKAPVGFFNNEAKESFEQALFKSRNGRGK